jgi:tetratricopeptide (TPR) repeat protein
MMAYRFSYYFSKSQSVQAVRKDAEKFLGQKPVIELQDSLGNPVRYFQETFYDDDLFAKAISEIDKAIDKYQDRLDFRAYKITAYVNYEKESPDIATMDIMSLIDYNFTQKPKWVYPGEDNVDSDFFDALIQEYCVAFFKFGSNDSYNAFEKISQRMLSYEPDNILFLDNMGSFFLVYERDNKTALKYYNKVLKLKKDDMTAIQNCILLARNSKDVKLEKKYLGMMAQYGASETDRKSAQARLELLDKK